MSEFLFFIIGTMLGGLFGIACIKHRNKLDKQLDAWILPLVFDRLDVSGSIADYSRKLLPRHPSGFTGFFDCLSYRSKIEVKMIVPFVH